MSIRDKSGNHLWYMPLYSGIVRDCDLDPTWVLPGQEVELPCLRIFTSRPYAVLEYDAITAPFVGTTHGLIWLPPSDDLEVGVTLLAGDNREPRVYFAQPATDFLRAGTVTLLSGTNASLRKTHSQPPTDFLRAGQVTVLAGTNANVRREYRNWPAESLRAGSVTLLSGTNS